MVSINVCLVLVTLLAAFVGTANAAVSPAERTALLNEHNKVRRNVSPAAANMRAIVWDRKQAALAQRHANKCNFSHSQRPERNNAGENIGLGMFLTIACVCRLNNPNPF